MCLAFAGCKSPDTPAPAAATAETAPTIERSKLPPAVQQRLEIDTPFSPAAAAAVKRLSRETQNRIERCLTTTDGYACFLAFTRLDVHRARADPDEEIKRRLYKRGCALGNPEGCTNWARTVYPADPGQYDDALAVFTRNCETTFVFSCEDVGNLLRERGRDAEAMEAYAKVCTNDETRGCEALGKLSQTEAQQAALKQACGTGQGGSCLAYDAALKQSAKTLMIDRCLQASPTLRSTAGVCEKAADAIDLPFDVRQFVGMQQACFRIDRGEYYGPWSRYIVEGLKEPCVDRNAEYAALTNKYRNSPELLFALQRHKSKRVDGKWVWEIEQPETNH